jgi:predicted molibdopterin-dependent oxidoreductase YjgC
MNKAHNNRIGRSSSDADKTGDPISFQFNGQEITGYAGESIAAALIAADITTNRTSPTGMPRGYFCGMGVCWECIVRINGKYNQRACLQLLEPGMIVETVVSAKKS